MRSTAETSHPRVDPRNGTAQIAATVTQPLQVHGLGILIILSALMAFASISTDLYLPAMPSMETALHAQPGAIELTVSGYLMGFSLGQLVWGPLGDRLGRRLPIALGLMLFILGSAGCALSNSAGTMIGWRVVQAAGACASVVLARAMVRDLYSGDQAARMMSTLMTVMAIAPLLGPSVGGLVLQVSSWRAIFWLLVVVGIGTLAAVYILPETLPSSRRVSESTGAAFARYFTLLKNPRLLAYAAVGGCLYGGMYAYIAGTPFAYINYYHVSSQHYGLLFALGIVGIMVANMLNARFVARLGSDKLMTVGAVLALLSGLWTAVNARSGWGGLAGLVLPLFLFVSSAGLIVANAITGALGVEPRFAGSISALIGASQYGTGILGSAMVGAFSDGTPWPMAAVMALFGVGSFVASRFVKPRSTLKPEPV